ncbi:MAG: hypothetical protein NZM40_02550 [Sphingomonadaceae bacterium]|uniref:hypothetical protein n=1 Tax=Thermaurantiacus sp. TaxID=2820283 RepID=UPI00298EE1D9|nr:hypothetical protein [Thermaurantiacus sp.]MCS6986305.1 hypothetical protein [Sphingomonadaceae bacterium]MDW8415754.1 hypothetical protein [Thermaurantiacus sp.]
MARGLARREGPGDRRGVIRDGRNEDSRQGVPRGGLTILRIVARTRARDPGTADGKSR